MKELHRIKQRIEKENLTDIHIVASSVKNAEVIRSKLKNTYLRDMKIEYHHIVNSERADGINYYKSAIILWDRWFENDKVNKFIMEHHFEMPHIFNVSDF